MRLLLHPLSDLACLLGWAVVFLCACVVMRLLAPRLHHPRLKSLERRARPVAFWVTRHVERGLDHLRSTRFDERRLLMLSLLVLLILWHLLWTASIALLACVAVVVVSYLLGLL
jgi:hypothetical protein